MSTRTVTYTQELKLEEEKSEQQEKIAWRTGLKEAQEARSSTFKPRPILSIASPTAGSLGASRISQVVQQDRDRIPHDPILLLDNFDNIVSVDRPAGAGDHPHRGFTILTYLHPESTASFLHEDSGGHTGVLRPGALQWLEVGRGTIHNEGPESNGRTFGLQLWLNIPVDRRSKPATYRDFNPEDITEVEEDGVRVRVVSGTSLGATPQHNLSRDRRIIFLHVYLKPGARLQQPIPQGDSVILYTFNGTPTINESSDVVAERQRVVFGNEKDADGIVIENGTEKEIDFVIIGGTPQPSDERTVVWGPFVSDSEEGILNAFDDYVHSKHGSGFDNASEWKSERGKIILRGRRRYLNPPKLNADGTLPVFNNKDYILPPID